MQNLFWGRELEGHVWAAIRGSTSWFDLMDSLGVMEQWLQSADEGTNNRILWLLTFVQQERSERTAELLSDFVGSSESWNTRLAGLFTRSDIAVSRAFFDFVLTLIGTGAVDGMLYPGRGGDHLWLPVEKVVKSHPEWVCELIAAYLDRLLLVVGASGSGEENPLRFGRESTGEQVIVDAANSAPQRFVELLLPRMTSMMETYADRSHGPPWRDRVWGTWSYQPQRWIGYPSPCGLGSLSMLGGAKRS